MTKNALDEETFDKEHIQSKIENMLHPDWEGVNEREFGMLSAMDDDEHLSRLRNIATESIFIDLLNTDAYLKTKDPEAVLEAYNDIIEVAPHLRGKKMALRQALREYLATESLDLATIGQLDKMETDAANRSDAKNRARADQASRFAQNQQKRKHDAEDLELKREAIQQRREEAHQKAVIAANDLAHKKKELKSRESEAKSLREERAERYKVEDERAKEELRLKQHASEQDDLDAKLKREEFEHKKNVDKDSKNFTEQELNLKRESFNYQKQHDTKTDNRLEEEKKLHERSTVVQEETLKHKKNVDQGSFELAVEEAKARIQAESKQQEELEKYHNAQLTLQEKELESTLAHNKLENVFTLGRILGMDQDLEGELYNPNNPISQRLWSEAGFTTGVPRDREEAEAMANLHNFGIAPGAPDYITPVAYTSIIDTYNAGTTGARSPSSPPTATETMLNPETVDSGYSYTAPATSAASPGTTRIDEILNTYKDKIGVTP